MTGAADLQIAAANPQENTWLTANAGSGKTRVLTDRVARLLLGGADPMGILCLTYTKAAAAEMQNRLFQTLGRWAMAPDDVLRDSLETLGETGLTDDHLREARRLFAKAIETPGGIRIQTIHSFCAALLRRFPLEAGVGPGFAEIDDRSARLLQQEILEEMALGPDAGALDGFLAWSSGEIGKQLGSIIGARADFAAAPRGDDLRRALGVPDGLDEDAVLARVFLGGEDALIQALVTALATGGLNDKRMLQRLLAILPLQPDMATLAALENEFLTGASAKVPFSAKVGAVPSKAARPALGTLADQIDKLMLRVEAARADRLALALARKTEALHRFARAFLRRYQAAKDRRGWVDFDDLVVLATGLLSDPSLSAWVLFRLDGGIQHVLVDEAQDTSPAQWRLIQLLTAEFTAGIGRHDKPRTLFVVGDKKQSIYSFQGADVTAFDAVRDRFGQAFHDAGSTLHLRPLLHSFRSSPAILRLVDLTFRGDLAGAMGGAPLHEAQFADLPGRVDFWHPVDKPEKAERGDWFHPEDRTGAESEKTALARRVAESIRDMIKQGVQIRDRDTWRPVHEGDVLILVRGRQDGLFDALIRACKTAGLQIAGADRLKLTEELAVRDILALLAFLNTQDDSLSLATALRSPLFGLTEAELFRLAHGRDGVLWERLRRDDGLAGVRAVLDDLRSQSDFLRPYELIDRILTRHDGRRLLLGRLGAEAEDGIDELLSQALAYEQIEVPSLTGFLVWLTSGEVEAKRQAEAEGHRIRVMTVHGAKGLEAPVVILPDTADRRPKDEGSILVPEGAPPIWALGSAEATALQQRARQDGAARQEAESLRLLYVAVTRARCWLIVAAAGKVSDRSWYGLLRAAAADLPMQPLDGGRERHEFGHWLLPAPRVAADQAPVALPDWALRPAPAPQAPAPPLLPSDLGGDKTLAGDTPGDPDAQDRGTLLHRLLERLPDLPPPAREAAALALGADPDSWATVRRILDDPALAWIFAPGSLAEAGFALPFRGRTLLGSIDRLVVGEAEVAVIDYKSNAVVPDHPEQVPEGYLRQLGAYAAAAAELFPGRRVSAHVLWTATAQLMPLDPEIVSAALDRAAIP
jgi:ATP-dependent helicase/nuclease subunit A